MSSIASNAEDLILNADGGSSTVKIKINGTEKASISSAGAFTSTTIDATKLTGALPAISGAALTGVGVAGITSAADATAITITSAEKIGIGTASPLGTTHIQTASSGATADSSADDLVVENSGHAGLSILSGASNNGSIYFGDSGTNWDGYIAYSQTYRKMTLGTAAGGGSLSIDATGAVTIPNQPAFLAKLASNMNNIPNSTWTTIEASTEIFDQNSDYNTSTYTFTAPVTGRYQFNAMVRMENVDNNTDYQYVVFSTDNRIYYTLQSWLQSSDVPQTHHQLAILADMDANDTCRVRVYIPNGHAASDIADTTIWSGHLVC